MDCLARFKRFVRIDRKMIPMKLHYFLYALAISAVMSYFPIMAKNIGVSATAVGIFYAVAPFTTVLMNPLFGWITDKLQRVKIVMIVMIIIQTPLFIGTVFVPPLASEMNSFPAELSCSSNNTYIITPKNLAFPPNNRSMKCRSDCTQCLQLGTAESGDVTLCGKNIKLETEEVYNISYEFIKVANISVKGKLLSSTCYEKPSNKCKTACDFEAVGQVYINDEFSSYQFWILLFLIVSSLVLANSTIAIGDAACYEALEGKVNKFGKQRVWLSVGWGVGTMFTGYFLDLTNPNKEKKVDFSYCAYVMIGLIVLDIIALSQTKLRKPPASKNILKDVCKIFTRPHPIIFATAALLIGSLSGVQWNYLFWYLEDMGATKFLLGLSIAVLCVLVETPFMFISGYIVKRIGRDNTMMLAFLAFATWFIPISYIQNPWWVLLIAFTQGPSYGLFYVALTSYGKIATAPGTEATMQTVLGAIFHGLGIGSGSLLAGVGFDVYGGRITYRFVGYFSVGAAIVYKFLTVFIAGEGTAVYKGNSEMAETGNAKKVSNQEMYTVS